MESKLRARGGGGGVGVNDKKGVAGRRRAAGVGNGRLKRGIATTGASTTTDTNSKMAALPSIHHSTKTSATAWQCSRCEHQNTYTKSRCSSCQRWRGGKMNGYSSSNKRTDGTDEWRGGKRARETSEGSGEGVGSSGGSSGFNNRGGRRFRGRKDVVADNATDNATGENFADVKEVTVAHLKLKQRKYHTPLARG